MTTYASRDNAIQFEIIDPLEASGEVADARAAYDVDAIAAAVLGDFGQGYASTVEPGEFWDIVAANQLFEVELHTDAAGSCDRMVVVGAADDGEDVVVGVVPSEDREPYDAALRKAGFEPVGDNAARRR